METFGWVIVKQIANSGDLISNANFPSDIQRGYKDGWLEGEKGSVSALDLYDEDKSLAYIPKFDKDTKPGFEEESQAYRLGYSLAINDCNRLHELGASISRNYSSNI